MEATDTPSLDISNNTTLGLLNELSKCDRDLEVLSAEALTRQATSLANNRGVETILFAVGQRRVTIFFKGGEKIVLTPARERGDQWIQYDCYGAEPYSKEDGQKIDVIIKRKEAIHNEVMSRPLAEREAASKVLFGI